MNADIATMLERVQRLRQDQGQTGKVFGYTRAIQAVRSYPKRIESYQEAVGIPGIGPSIASKIQEYLNTGTTSEIAPLDERNRVIEEFKQLHGVGNVIANKWYDMGYRRLQDVPESIMTDAQRISLKYRHELIQKIPRAEMNIYNQLLNEYFTSQGLQYQVCGSYRRGRPASGDIDVLVIDKPGINVMDIITRWPYLNAILGAGQKKILAICSLPPSSVVGPSPLHRRIDFELVQWYEYPYASMYFTGPASFNVKMRDYCKKFGLTLNEKSLVVDATGEHKVVQSEEQLFQVLGLKYLTPEERDAY